MIFRMMFFVFPLVVLSFASQASEGGAHALGLWDIVFPLTNFALLFLGIYFLLKRRAGEFFASRSLNVKMSVEKAKKLYDEAYRQYEEIDAKLKNADVEGKKLIADIKAESESEKKQIVAHAREMAEKIAADSKRMADQEVVKAMQRLKKEAVDLALQLARKKIESEINQEDQTRLGSGFVESVQKGF